MRHLIVLTVLLIATAAFAQGTMYESFEAGVPAEWSATRADSLSLTDAHYKHGTQSLRWDWQAGEEIAVSHGIGDASRKGGYGGYHKAAFAIWLYCEEPAEGDVVVRFEGPGDEPADSFRFPLGFTGWRRAVLHYRWTREHDWRVPSDTDTIRIVAPEAGEGVLFIDLVVYNGIIDYRQACIPVTEFAWEPVDPAEVRTPVARPEALTPAIEAGLEKVAGALDPRSDVDPISAERMGEHRANFEIREIVRDERGIRGQGLVVNPGLYETAGMADPPPNPSQMATDMREMAASWHYTTDQAQREQMAEWYLLMSDHLADQGFVAGSGNRWGGYAGRRLADAMLWMREPMRAAGRGEREAAFFDYNWGVSRVLDADRSLHVNLDEFGIVSPRKLRGCVMQPEPVDRAHWIACFADRLSQMMVMQARDGFKPDGSAYHHGSHYMAYASYNIPVLISVLNALDDTPWEASPEALAQLDLYLTNLSFYSNLLDVPFCMHGRHPFRGGANRASVYRTMALAGPGTGDTDFDPDLAATHLRLLTEDPEDPPFPEHDVTQAPPPTGNLTMPYAGITAHRRGNWLAVAHANTRWYW
ncbi:MAG: hypothetical protein GF393_02765, partial [Armatimonadia bacterium]|nr:hypothetical protein [Armatimonadia bacterium]